MKIRISRLLFLPILFASLTVCYGQTPLGGVVASNITLTKSNSPYFISTSLVVAANGKITIQPGVKILFGQNATLEVRGDLVAKGTSSDSIIFTAASVKTKGSWKGVTIVNPQGATADFDFCKFSFASAAVNETCCWNGAVAVRNSSFYNNITAISGYSGTITPVENCSFSFNTNAISHADKNIVNSTFDHNDFGLASTERTNVSNSTFTNHQVAIQASSGTVNAVTFENNDLAIKAFSSLIIKNSTISNNNNGIELNSTDGASLPQVNGSNKNL